jgi:hypothetical protein
LQPQRQSRLYLPAAVITFTRVVIRMIADDFNFCPGALKMLKL